MPDPSVVEIISFLVRSEIINPSVGKIMFLLFCGGLVLARGLFPLLRDPDYFNSMFKKRCRENRRRNDLPIGEFYQEDRRKATSLFPLYLNLPALKFIYFLFNLVAFICNVFKKSP